MKDYTIYLIIALLTVILSISLLKENFILVKKSDIIQTVKVESICDSTLYKCDTVLKINTDKNYKYFKIIIE